MGNNTRCFTMRAVLGAGVSGLLYVCFLVGFLLPAECQLITGFNPENGPVPAASDPGLHIENHWDYSGQWLTEYQSPTSIRFSTLSTHVIVGFKAGRIRIYADPDRAFDDYLAQVYIPNELYNSYDHGLSAVVLDPNFPNVPLGYALYAVQPVGAGPNNAMTQTPWPNTNTKLTSSRPVHWADSNCPNLGPAKANTASTAENPGNYGGKVCEHWARVARFRFDVKNNFAITRDASIFTFQCGGSSTHGTGNIVFTADGTMTFMTGDNAQYELVDPGLPNDDGCFDPTLGYPQGSWRSQRPEFGHGKLLSLTQAQYREGIDLPLSAIGVIAKGFRNPFRHHITPAGQVYVGDVGMGDVRITERIFSFPLTKGKIWNGGWPCVECLRSEDGPLGAAVGERAQVLLQYKANTCDAVYKSALGQTPGNDPNYTPPIFEYRGYKLDPTYALCSATGLASITGVNVYPYGTLGPKYKDGLFFSDHTIGCVWYFPAGAYPVSPPNIATPNATPQIMPKALVAGNGFVDISIDPKTGSVYLVDYTNKRIVRMSLADKVYLPPTAVQIVAPPVDPINVCQTTPFTLPELEWQPTDEPDHYTGTLNFDVFQFDTDYGTMRTRGYGGSVPGPVIRMKACSVYDLTLKNNMVLWKAMFPATGAVNTYRDPGVTNLHLHGMHISPEMPGDSMMVEVEPGEQYTYTYVIPCDHTGGTHWYHPHWHGSVALEVGGGATGVLIVEDNPRVDVDMPDELTTVTEDDGVLVIHKFSTTLLADIAGSCKDPVFKFTESPTSPTPGAESFYLVNGCSSLKLQLRAGAWTRLRILHTANDGNLFLNFFESVDPNAPKCEVGVLALDGVYLSEAPRMLDQADQRLFFSTASRVDVVVRCPIAAYNGGTPFEYNIAGYPDAGDTRVVLGKVSLLVSLTGIDAPALPAWIPCRPFYLMDLTKYPDTPVPFSVLVRGTLNGEIYNDKLPLAGMVPTEGTVYELTIDGTEIHPLHVHVNHMQYQSGDGNFILNWYRAGDWVDTVSILTVSAVVRLRHDRFGGTVMIHCHVPSHSDTGVISWYNIGGGTGSLSSPAILKWGTCPQPAREPRGATYAPSIPFVFVAADFDEGGEGISYSNRIPALDSVYYATRLDASVELRDRTDFLGHGQSEVISAMGGDFVEWLSYSFEAGSGGTFYAGLRIAGKAAGAGYQFSVLIDSTDCSSKEGEVALWTGFVEGAEAFETLRQDGIIIGSGPHVAVICVLEGADLIISSLAILSVEPSLGTPQPIPGTITLANTDASHSAAGALTKQPVNGGDGVGVTQIAAGDSQAYIVNVREAGSYTLGVLVSAPVNTAGDFGAVVIKLGPAPTCGDSLNIVATVDDIVVQATNELDRYYSKATATIGSSQMGVQTLLLCWTRASPQLTVVDLTLSLGGMPTTVPHNGLLSELPGLVIATNFDNPEVGFPGEGVSYHNVFVQPGLNIIRPDAAVETGVSGVFLGTANAVQYIMPGEYLTYTVLFAAPGTYNVAFNIATDAVAASHIGLSLKLNSRDCDTPDGLLVSVDDAAYVGSGVWGKFQTYYPAVGTFLVDTPQTQVPQVLTLCFLAMPVDGIELHSFSILAGDAPVCKTDVCEVVIH